VVAGLTEGVFPVTGQPVADWSKQPYALPFALRGDADELPVLDWRGATDRVEARDHLAAFMDACKQRSALEERRLAYVALTRARDVLLCSGYWWDGNKKSRGPSGFLTEVYELCRTGGGEIAVWADQPDDDDTNPLMTEPPNRQWPVDPLGSRREAVEAGAALVVAAMTEAATGDEGPSDGVPAEVQRWDRETGLLLAELARHRARGDGPVVALPGRLSVSQLVALRRDPAELARSLRRPLPRRPAPQARRGTRFHLWLEQRWGQQRLIDVDELPGAADETAEPDSDLLALQEAFRGSEWWARTPIEVEFPFDMVVDGLVLRGRCDAVFVDAADGAVDVVDWKTGRPPSGAEADAAAVQLAVYRLAWHHLSGTPLDRTRAAFHYVAHNRTVRPADLLDADGITELLRSVPQQGEAHSA
jgi:DNA helicase-2/ATP-dependent DNA helicase PcrA